MSLTPANLFALSSNLSSWIAELGKMGITVEIGDDFSAYYRYRTQITDRGPIYPMFDARSSFVDQTNGFWICGFDQLGELVHTQAVRLLDLRGCNLESHLARHRHKYLTPNSTPDPDHTYFVGPRALQSITGPVCYHGEFWLRARGLGGPRSLGATALLSKLLLDIAFASWEPSFFFGFVPRKLASKGAHLRYGYPHCEPGQWIGPNCKVTDEDYLIWMDAADLSMRHPSTLMPPVELLDEGHSSYHANDGALGQRLVLAGE